MEIVLGEGVVVGTSIVRFVAKLRLSVVARIEEAEETRGEDTIELDDVAGEMGLDQVVINAARTKIGERTVEGGTVGTEDHISTALRRRVAPLQPPQNGLVIRIHPSCRFVPLRRLTYIVAEKQNLLQRNTPQRLLRRLSAFIG